MPQALWEGASTVGSRSWGPGPASEDGLLCHLLPLAIAQHSFLFRTSDALTAQRIEWDLSGKTKQVGLHSMHVRRPHH